MQFQYALLALGAVSSVAQNLDPSTIDDATKRSWCLSQQSTCPLLCTQVTGGSAATYDNNCDATTLQYSCVCANEQSPNATEYTQTLPYFECTETNNRCVRACAQGDNTCAGNCRTQHPCGAKDPRRYNITTTASTMSATATGKKGASATGSAALATTTSVESVNGNSGGFGNAAAAVAADYGRIYGTASVLGAVFAGFALLL